MNDPYNSNPYGQAANPYAAPEARLDDQATEYLELADRGTRLGAKMIDGVASLVVMLPVFVMIGLSGASGRQSEEFGVVAMILVGVLGLALLAWQLYWLHLYSQTIGKRALGIKIVRTDGSRADLGRIVGMRWLPVSLLGAIPLIGPIISLVDPLMIFREDRRCMHDLIADTVVVKA